MIQLQLQQIKTLPESAHSLVTQYLELQDKEKETKQLLSKIKINKEVLFTQITDVLKKQDCNVDLYEFTYKSDKLVLNINPNTFPNADSN